MDLTGLTAADVMLRSPKTLPASATVGDVRAMLDNKSVQMVLLADGARFAGAVTALPEDAADGDPALDYADSSPEALRASDSAQAAFDTTAGNPHRRVVVLGDGEELLGLVCLDESRSRFCGGVQIGR